MCFRDCPGSGSAETAGSRRQTGNSWLIKHGDGGQHSGGVWRPTFQPGDKPPLYQLEQASVSRTPHHTTPPIISNKPYPSRRPQPFPNTLHLHNRPDWLTRELEVHWQASWWSCGGMQGSSPSLCYTRGQLVSFCHFIMSSRLVVWFWLITVKQRKDTKPRISTCSQDKNWSPGNFNYRLTAQTVYDWDFIVTAHCSFICPWKTKRNINKLQTEFVSQLCMNWRNVGVKWLSKSSLVFHVDTWVQTRQKLVSLKQL